MQFLPQITLPGFFPPLFIPMVTLMFVAAFTPGPNNIMLASSGANFGFIRTIPHITGVVTGFAGVVILSGLVLDALFTRLPAVQDIFRITAMAFIIWLAWRIASSTESGRASGRSRPLFFGEAALFQLINPKGVGMSATVISTYIDPGQEFLPQFVILLAAFFVVTLLSAITWAEFGVLIRGLLNTPMRLRIFNIGMAILLVASMLPVLVDIV